MDTIDPRVTGRRRFKKQRRPLWPSRTVCEYFADITPRTLHRWKNDPTMGFPQPTTVNHRDYYDADAIEAFALKRRVIAEHEKAAASAPAVEAQLKPKKTKKVKKTKKPIKPKPTVKEPARPRKEHAAASTDQFEVTT